MLKYFYGLLFIRFQHFSLLIPPSLWLLTFELSLDSGMHHLQILFLFCSLIHYHISAFPFNALKQLNMAMKEPIIPSENEKEPKSSVPLITITAKTDSEVPCANTSREIVNALKNSGFFLIKTPLLNQELQSRALVEAETFLSNPTPDKEKYIITHPTDPKTYTMLDSKDIEQYNKSVLKDYMNALEKIKMDVLRHIAVGLDMKDHNFFTKLHDENNDTLRLILYHPTNSQETGNRCKEHSDYGTITLLSTDGVSGLEIFHEGIWVPVPHVDGALVVNIGSLLSGWTKGALCATLHRVAGPASLNSTSSREHLLKAVKHKRTSIAFFADPNKDVSINLSSNKSESISKQEMSISEYIEWRSGGSGDDRSGVSFTSDESNLMQTQLKKAKSDN